MEVQGRALTLQEFLALPEGEANTELIDGQVVAKMAPKYFHAVLQVALLKLLGEWGLSRGRVLPEWGLLLRRQSVDWVPVPDLVFISYDRLPRSWSANAACPMVPELVVEIISPGQTFGQLTAKAEDYLKAGVSQVWVVDGEAQTITVFYPDGPPRTYEGTQPMDLGIFTDLALSAAHVFIEAGL